MEVIHLKAGENVAKRKDKVSAWYIVQEGNVTLRHEFEETTLGPNAIIGILEQDWFICDYYASTDVTLYVFPCEGVNDLKQFLAAEPKMRRIFLRSALLQRHQLFCAYADMYHKVRQFQNLSDTLYEEYVYLCARSKVEAKQSLDVANITPLEMQHKAENWEINNSNSLIRGATGCISEPYGDGRGPLHWLDHGGIRPDASNRQRYPGDDKLSAQQPGCSL